MPNQIFEMQSVVKATPEEVYAWHGRPHAFDRIMPHWERTSSAVVSHDFKNGLEVAFQFYLGPAAVPWVARYQDVVPGREFTDVQIQGPFPYWKHTHLFLPEGEGCRIIDRVEYALPGGVLGDWLGGPYARQRLERMFAHRHVIMKREFDGKPQDIARNILVTGATGLIGSSLVPLLSVRGHHVTRLTRTPQIANDVAWDPEKDRLEESLLEAQDVVVHLAGENIAGYWTEEKKEKILQSRLQGTRLLVDRMLKTKNRPGTFIAASAIGYYGDRDEDLLTEEATPGKGFLAEVCRAWEETLKPLEHAGVRVVIPRIGVVLSPRGGALKAMKIPFLCGLGGRIGSGRQYLSWIAIDDVCGLIHHAVCDDRLVGPVNAVAPNPVSNREFTETLARVLRRPAFFPVPAAAAKLLLGELAQELLLASLRVSAHKALGAGYVFQYSDLEPALRYLLGASEIPQ